jgi:hypothetical protein
MHEPDKDEGSMPATKRDLAMLVPILSAMHIEIGQLQRHMALMNSCLVRDNVITLKPQTKK